MKGYGWMTSEYDTYVIRIWPYDDRKQVQKIVVENPHTGSKVRFSNWSDFVAFLQTKRASLGEGFHLEIDSSHPNSGVGDVW
jgi:hypothetical protein